MPKQSTRNRIEALLFRLLKWRIRHLSNKNFLLLVSVVVGLVAGSAAVILKSVVHHIQNYLQFGLTFPYHTTLYIVFPLLGILLTVLFVNRFLKGRLGRGLSSVLFSIARKGSRIEPSKTWSHLVTSALTIGFGGSAGLEAPIVVTGSALGSNIGRLLRLSYQDRTLLLGCGAAAGISAVFNCPIAGVIFAFEILLEGFSIPAFIPLLLASATAAVISKLGAGQQLFYLITTDWQVANLPFYTLLGFLCGLVSVYMTRTSLFMESWFARYKSKYRKAVFGGLVLGGLIFALPPLYGEGYILTQALLNANYNQLLVNNSFFEHSNPQWWLLIVLGIIILLMKVIATSITVGAGGNGGIFAPSLFTGSLLGFTFSFGVNQFNWIQLPVSNFIAAGMAGILSGVVHAPLTAIFLIAEITGGYSLFVPLMIVSAGSFFISRIFEPYSIYTNQLAKRGIESKQNKDFSVLRSMRLKTYTRKTTDNFHPDFTLGQVVSVIAASHRDVFPVLEENGKLIGIVQLDDIREILFKRELYDKTFVRNFMKQPEVVIQASDPMNKVIGLFSSVSAEELPVAEDELFVGMISKSDVLAGYRNKLIRKSKELS